MGFLGFGKNKDVVDLGKRYREQQSQKASTQTDNINSSSQDTSSASPFGFFDNAPTSSQSSDSGMPSADSADDRKRRLAKRISDMTNKIEDLSNQIYHLQQRVELLERKTGTNNFE